VIVTQVDKADRSVFVPAVHGVDGFLQLRAAAFVYATRINPDVIQLLCFGKFHRPPNFAVFGLAQRLKRTGAGYFGIVHFFVLPGVRKNCIRWHFRFDEFFQAEGIGVYEPHLDLITKERRRNRAGGSARYVGAWYNGRAKQNQTRTC